MAEALYQVKSAMGNDAVILHTRTYWRRRWLGLRRIEVVEITAGAGLQTARRDPRRQLSSRGSRPRPRLRRLRRLLLLRLSNSCKLPPHPTRSSSASLRTWVL
jgi:flagellar biosynthesis GTPase FlhF